MKYYDFVNAGDLYVGDVFLDFNVNILIVEDRKVETLNKPVKVYNFQVEDFHMYLVGRPDVLVYNASIEYESGSNAQSVGNPVEVEGRRERKYRKDGS